MSHQNIEEVAVKYLADWIQLMKVVNHRSTNRAKESDLIDFIFEEFIKNTSPVVQKFWNIFLKIKGHNAKAFVQQSNIEFLGQANKRRIQIKLAPVDITREADIRTFGSSLEISMIPQQSINKILRELLDQTRITIGVSSQNVHLCIGLSSNIDEFSGIPPERIRHQEYVWSDARKSWHHRRCQYSFYPMPPQGTARCVACSLELETVDSEMSKFIRDFTCKEKSIFTPNSKLSCAGRAEKLSNSATEIHKLHRSVSNTTDDLKKLRSAFGRLLEEGSEEVVSLNVKDSTLVDNIFEELSTNPKLFIPLIKKQCDVEFDESDPDQVNALTDMYNKFKEQVNVWNQRQKGKRGSVRYSQNLVTLGLQIYQVSPAAFKSVSKELYLPSRRQLQHYKAGQAISQGSCAEVYVKIIEATKGQKFNGQLICDEFKIVGKLIFDSRSDEIIGLEELRFDFTELGKTAAPREPAQYVNQWLFRSLDSSDVFVLEYFASDDKATAEALWYQFFHVLVQCENINLLCYSLISDAGSANVRLVRLLIAGAKRISQDLAWLPDACVTFQNPFDLNRNFFCNLCMTHGMKSVRNAIFNHDYKIKEGCIISWRHQEALLKRQVHLSNMGLTRTLCSFNHDAVYLDNHLKMNMPLCKASSADEVIAAYIVYIESIINIKCDTKSSNMKKVEYLISQVDKWDSGRHGDNPVWTLHYLCVLNALYNNLFSRPGFKITKHNIDGLEEQCTIIFTNYFLVWKKIASTNKDFKFLHLITWTNLRLAFKSAFSLARYCLSALDMEYITASRLNTSVIELLFCCARSGQFGKVDLTAYTARVSRSSSEFAQSVINSKALEGAHSYDREDVDDEDRPSRIKHRDWKNNTLTTDVGMRKIANQAQTCIISIIDTVRTFCPNIITIPAELKVKIFDAVWQFDNALPFSNTLEQSTSMDIEDVDVTISCNIQTHNAADDDDDLDFRFETSFINEEMKSLFEYLGSQAILVAVFHHDIVKNTWLLSQHCLDLEDTTLGIKIFRSWADKTFRDIELFSGVNSMLWIALARLATKSTGHDQDSDFMNSVWNLYGDLLQKYFDNSMRIWYIIFSTARQLYKEFLLYKLRSSNEKFQITPGQKRSRSDDQSCEDMKGELEIYLVPAITKALRHARKVEDSIMIHALVSFSSRTIDSKHIPTRRLELLQGTKKHWTIPSENLYEWGTELIDFIRCNFSRMLALHEGTALKRTIDYVLNNDIMIQLFNTAWISFFDEDQEMKALFEEGEEKESPNDTMIRVYNTLSSKVVYSRVREIFKVRDDLTGRGSQLKTDGKAKPQATLREMTYHNDDGI